MTVSKDKFLSSKFSIELVALNGDSGLSSLCSNSVVKIPAFLKKFKKFQVWVNLLKYPRSPPLFLYITKTRAANLLTTLAVRRIDHVLSSFGPVSCN